MQIVTMAIAILLETKTFGWNIILFDRCKYAAAFIVVYRFLPHPTPRVAREDCSTGTPRVVWLTRIRWVVTMTQSVSDGVRIKYPYTSNRRFGCHFRNNIILLCNATYYYTYTISLTCNIYIVIYEHIIILYYTKNDDYNYWIINFFLTFIRPYVIRRHRDYISRLAILFFLSST